MADGSGAEITHAGMGMDARVTTERKEQCIQRQYRPIESQEEWILGLLPGNPSPQATTLGEARLLGEINFSIDTERRTTLAQPLY